LNASTCGIYSLKIAVFCSKWSKLLVKCTPFAVIRVDRYATGRLPYHYALINFLSILPCTRVKVKGRLLDILNSKILNTCVTFLRILGECCFHVHYRRLSLERAPALKE